MNRPEFLLLSGPAGEEVRPIWVRKDAILWIERRSGGASVQLSNGLHLATVETADEVLRLLGEDTGSAPEPGPSHEADVFQVLMDLNTLLVDIGERVDEIVTLVTPMRNPARFYVDDPKRPDAG